ncbi:MAG: flippase [Candidatus Pacearchaeota archaeon]|nr:flippase [Candidatus Pacearchaeota archaeon]
MQKETITERTTKNAFYTFFSVLASRIGGLVLTIIVARILYPELFGVYSLVLSIILTIATFTDLGMNTTFIRYFAESIGKNKRKEARTRFFFFFKYKIFLICIASFVLFVFSDMIAINIFKKPLMNLPLKIGSLYLLALSLNGFFSSVFVALQKVKYNLVSEIIFQISRITMVLLFLYLNKNVVNVFLALSVSFFLSSLFLFFVLSKKYNFLFRGKRSKIEKKEKKKLLNFFTWLTIGSISLIFFAHIDIFMLGIFLPAEFTGYYHAIVSLVTSVAAFVAFGSLLLPVFTQLEQGRAERGFEKVFRYVSFLAFPAAFGLAFVAVPAIKIIFGYTYVLESYKTAITIAAAILSFLVIESAFSGIYSALFQARELPKIIAVIMIIATILNIFLNYFFIKIGISFAPQYGLVGVAAATFISKYFNLITLGIMARKKLKIKTNFPYKQLLASGVMLLFLFFFDYFFKLSIFKGILMIFFAILVYFFTIYLMKEIKKEDFKLIKIFLSNMNY